MFSLFEDFSACTMEELVEKRAASKSEGTNARLERAMDGLAKKAPWSELVKWRAAFPVSSPAFGKVEKALQDKAKKEEDWDALVRMKKSAPTLALAAAVEERMTFRIGPEIERIPANGGLDAIVKLIDEVPSKYAPLCVPKMRDILKGFADKAELSAKHAKLSEKSPARWMFDERLAELNECDMHGKNVEQLIDEFSASAPGSGSAYALATAIVAHISAITSFGKVAAMLRDAENKKQSSVCLFLSKRVNELLALENDIASLAAKHGAAAQNRHLSVLKAVEHRIIAALGAHKDWSALAQMWEAETDEQIKRLVGNRFKELCADMEEYEKQWVREDLETKKSKLADMLKQNNGGKGGKNNNNKGNRGGN